MIKVDMIDHWEFYKVIREEPVLQGKRPSWALFEQLMHEKYGLKSTKIYPFDNFGVFELSQHDYVWFLLRFS
jgi:hypothetical protein